MATLVKSKLRDGIYSAEFSDIEQGDGLGVVYQGERLANVGVTQSDQGNWVLHAPIPMSALSEGVHSFVITDSTDQHLGQFAILAGDLADSDIRAELDLLRSELDMLKKAFRRHCVETMG